MTSPFSQSLNIHSIFLILIMIEAIINIKKLINSGVYLTPFIYGYLFYLDKIEFNIVLLSLFIFVLSIHFGEKEFTKQISNKNIKERDKFFSGFKLNTILNWCNGITNYVNYGLFIYVIGKGKYVYEHLDNPDLILLFLLLIAGSTAIYLLILLLIKIPRVAVDIWEKINKE